MKAQFVFENIDFERGKDPKEAMGIGNEDHRMINSLDKMAKKIGMKLAHVSPNNPNRIATWTGLNGSYVTLIKIKLVSRKEYLSESPDYIVEWDNGRDDYGTIEAEYWMEENENAENNWNRNFV